MANSTVPSPPEMPVVTEVTATSISAYFNDTSNGGSEIDGRQLELSINGANAVTPYTNSFTFKNLTPGQTYRLRGRVRNANGWSAWGPAKYQTTIGAGTVPSPPEMPVVTEVTKTSISAYFNDTSNGGSEVQARQLELSINGANAVTPYTNSFTFKNLITGQTYRLRGRVQNASGWSAWGPAKYQTTIGAVRVSTNGLWYLAIPYVKSGGIWKQAEPMVRDNGEWKASG